jgi:hypothetical protein
MNKPLIFALSLLLLISCKNDDNSNTEVGVFANITTDLPQSSWNISYFFENSVDETSDFASFSFTFNADGTVDAANDIFSESGTWRYEDSSNDSTDDDGIEDDEELILQFSANGLLDDLSDDWHITSASSSEVVLYDISGGNGTTNYLTFTKE